MRLFVFTLCHGHYIFEFIKQNPAFAKTYDLHLMPNYLFRLQTPEQNIEYRNNIISQIEKADVIIYQPVSSKHLTWSTDELLKSATSTCQLIRLPNFYNTALFPLCNLGDYMGSKCFGEETILECILAGNTLNDIITKYQSNQLDWKFESRFEDNIRRAKQEEALSNVKYIDFFLENYRDYQLFKNALYPTDTLFIHIANQIMDLLKLPGDRPNPLNTRVCVSTFVSSSAIYHYQLKWSLVHDSNINPNDPYYVNQIKDQYEKLSQLEAIKNHLQSQTSYTF